MTSRNTLGKKERLKSRKQIDQLFRKGKKWSFHPLRILYQFSHQEESPLQFGVSVSTRQFKRATDRNRVKRLLREAWRLQKAGLQQQLSEAGKTLRVFIIYTDRQLPLFQDIYSGVSAVIERLSQEAEEIK